MFCKGQAFAVLSRVIDLEQGIFGIIDLLPSKIRKIITNSKNKTKSRNKKECISRPANQSPVCELGQINKIKKPQQFEKSESKLRLQICDSESLSLPKEGNFVNYEKFSTPAVNSSNSRIKYLTCESHVFCETNLSTDPDLKNLSQLLPTPSLPQPKVREIPRPKLQLVPHFFTIPDYAFEPDYGMKWHSNSCYLESVIFSLFYGSDHFDSIVECTDSDTLEIAAVKKILQNIINTLRNDHILEVETYSPLRSYLADVTNNQGYLQEMMDAAELLCALFSTALGLEGFYTHADGSFRVDYILSPYLRRKLPEFSSLQDILIHDLASNGYPIISRPWPGFIVVKPEGPLENVAPSPQITLPMADGSRLTMDLVAVICYSDLHFSCYIKDSNGWIYAPGLNAPVIRTPMLALKMNTVSIDQFEEPSDSSIVHFQDICSNAYVYFYI